jgi:hypothetical protein
MGVLRIVRQLSQRANSIMIEDAGIASIPMSVQKSIPLHRPESEHLELLRLLVALAV